MPLYEYKCSDCGAQFEIIQKVNDKPLRTCVRCGGAVQKVLSPPALQFKGNGWYVTDYAPKKISEPEKKSKDKTSPSKKKKGSKKKEA